MPLFIYVALCAIVRVAWQAIIGKIYYALCLPACADYNGIPFW